MAERNRRTIERLALLGASIVVGLLFYVLYGVLEKDMEEVPRRLEEGSLVNLNAPDAAARFRLLLQKGYYFDDPRDINLVGEAMARGLAGETAPLDNIGEINKARYQVGIRDAISRGGSAFQKRARTSRALLGFTDSDSVLFFSDASRPLSLPAEAALPFGSGNIEGGVKSRAGAPVAGVLIRLQLVIPEDSLYSNELPEVERLRTENKPQLRTVYALDSNGRRQLQSFSAYARTDAQGRFKFSGLEAGRAYEVLPLQPGFAFGPSKGVPQLGKNLSLSFTQQPHQLRLLSGRDFNNLKRERSLIVRTPDEVRTWVFIIAGVFLLSFWLVHLFLSLRSRGADPLLLPVLLLLTGLSMITLLSLQDPLRDRFLGRTTLYFFTAGMAGLFLLLLFNLQRFTPDAGFYRLFYFRSPRWAKGWQWAGAGLLLLLLTILLGTGPEGSGVKVNLFGFQPSEVVKFLLLLFLAGFFTLNERFISEYASFGKRWSFFSLALAAIIGAILLFLMLGDLGPAIVICFTFIILFSFSRGDFAQMAGTVLVYVLVNIFLKNVWLATGLTAVLFLLYTWLVSKRLSESSVMALVVIASFLLLDQVPLLDRLFPGPIQRLVDRKAIWLDAWNNEVFGGDQVANGIWAMSSGGVTGQGIGEGFAKTIPEAHTDMILPSIGEEFGWTGIACVFILFLLFLHRAILIGRQTGRPFLFYLCAGIGIGSFVQFLLIAGGSTGLLPLSGIALPFVSYGGTSLIVNLLAAGFLLSASGLRGSSVQMQYIRQQQDRNLVPALVAALVGVVLLTVNISRYLFNNESWVVKPALVADRSGARMFSYNPRIAILMNRLQAGSIYDRNHLLLATSRPEQLLRQRDSLTRSGLTGEGLLSLSRKRLDRYYPFAEQLFFWTGDANTGVFSGGTNGYFAEYELAPALRGFETPMTSFVVKATRYREDRFLPRTEREMTVVRRDFSALAPLLLAGINSAEVETFKRRNRDVQLSLDASLQTALQQGMSRDDSLRSNRVSIVILEDNSGNVLSSASWPLPPVNDWEALNLSEREQNRLPYFMTLRDPGFTLATQPGSTAKLATALAAFNKLGTAAAEQRILIRPQDLIRVKGPEPDEPGLISLERAIVKSNNSYFIRLANEQNLAEEMGTVYIKSGMFLRGAGGYFYEREPNAEEEEGWRKLWRRTEFTSLRSYNPNDIRRTRGRGVSGMAWGQGELIATPAAVARMAAGIANGGLLVPHRFVVRIADSVPGTGQGEKLANDPQYAALLTAYMKAQSASKKDRLGLAVAGKTGTPERILHGQRINDGWYVFFVPKAKGAGHIVACIRIEQTKGSSNAVRLAGTLVIPELLRRGYIRSFDAPEENDPARQAD